MNLKKNLGKRIKFLRIRKNMTQETFAESVGISQRALSAIECGQSFMSAETLEKVAEKLDVTLEELFTLEHIKSTDILFNEIYKNLEIIEQDKDKNKIETIYRFIKSFI